jgi:hypothetical protein
MSRRSDTAVTVLWPESDEPDDFEGERTQTCRWRLLCYALLGGVVLLVPTVYHVRDVDQADGFIDRHSGRR